MTRSELATLYDQLRLAPMPPARERDAHLAAETFNGWLKGRRRKMLQAAGNVARGEPVPSGSRSRRSSWAQAARSVRAGRVML